VVDCTDPRVDAAAGTTIVEAALDIILPVAGLGSRLRPQTWSKPKPLVGLAGKPILEHVLDRLMPLQPDRLIFITGFLGDQIETWATSWSTVPTHFVVQPEMRGQTDAIIRTRDLVDGDALILFPDMIFEADFAVLKATIADVVAFTKEVDDPSAFGIALEEEGRVTKLIEKPQDPVSHQALVGLYYVRTMREMFEAIDEQMDRGIMLKNEYFIADAVQLMIDRGANVVTAPVTVWEDCGNVEALLATNQYLLKRDAPPSQPRPDATIVAPSFVADDAVIERSVVGPYASIGAGATIRDAVVGDAIVEDGASIDGVVVRHAVIGRKASLRAAPLHLNIGDNSTVEL